MCNYLHDDYKPIPEKGIGWKLFREEKNLCSIFGEAYQGEGWIEWKNELVHDYLRTPNAKMGFCFCLKYEEALELKSLFVHTVMRVKRIAYSGGLGTCLEDRIVMGQVSEIALCKTFRILDELESASTIFPEGGTR